MAGEETIGRATIQLGVDGSKLAPEMAAAVAKAQGSLERANKQMERAQASTFKAIQGHIDRINAARPTHEMRMLEQAVQKLGGTANLTKDQLGRVTAQVNALAAAGAKVPASLSGLTGMGSKLTAAFSSLTTGGGVSGALAAIGPAGVAAAGALGAVTLAGGAAVREITSLASKAEEWSNLAASTGLGTTQVQQLSALLEDAGIPADALAKAMKELQKEIATGGKELEKFGIVTANLRDLSPEEQLRAMAAQVAAIQDPATRAAASLAAFGRSGTDLLPVMDDVAKGADKMYGALSSEQVDSLARADAALDAFGRKWDITKKRVLGAVVEMIQGFRGFAGTIPVFLPNVAGAAGAAAKKAGGGPTDTQKQAEQERQKRAQEFAQRAAHDKAERAGESARKKAADDMLAVRRKYNELQASIVKRTEDEAGLMRDLDEQSKSILETAEKAEKARVSGMKEGRLRGGDMLGSVGGSGLWTRFQDVLDQELENAAEKTKQAATETKDWGSSLNTLATQLQTLAMSTGGFTGKLAGLFAALSSGAGGILSGIQGFKDSGKGLLGVLGKISGIGGIIGSAAGLIGGIKKLFGGKSKEEKAAEAAAKKQAAEEARQAKIQAAQEKLQSLQSAKGFAESLMDRLAKGGLTEGLSKALGTIVGKIGAALEAAGLGSLDKRLKDSEAFQATSQLGSDVAGALGAASGAGIFDAGLAAAGGAAAQEIMAQAIADATAAGLTAQEAQRAGFQAVAGILREQLNASIRSGAELDANTQKLLDEAKANGIEILADPAIESLGVQKEQLGVLHQIAGQGAGRYGSDVPAAGGFGPMITPNLGRGLGPRIQTHPGELAMVIPRSKMGPGGILSAARGVYSDLGRGGRARGGSSTSINLNIAEDPFQTSEGRMRLRRHTLRTVERQTSKRLGALIAAGRA